MNPKRIVDAITKWAGMESKLETDSFVRSIKPIDYRKMLSELKRALQNQPIRIETRIGLTLQQLQTDLAQLKPELVMLDCHGTKEGTLLFENGQGQAEFVPGDKLFSLFESRPKVLFLAACHSERVLDRAKESADWRDSTIVSVLGETPIEVTACVAFQRFFYSELLRGQSAGEAFDAAQKFVTNDRDIGDFAFESGKMPASKKFQINTNGREVRLELGSAASTANPESSIRAIRIHQKMIRRSAERFVGRRRELAAAIAYLLPRRGGFTHGAGESERRLVTLTKEGGIGKTSLAVELADWVVERQIFPGGVYELACERFNSATEFLSHLLRLLGIPFDQQRGDLNGLLQSILQQDNYRQPALLFLDNLDDLFGNHVAQEIRDECTEILEIALTIAPELRILATCRWPLGLSAYEIELKVGPMAEDEAFDVFVSHLASPFHRAQATQATEAQKSILRELVLISGLHPLSLQLLARQMGRPGMTFEALLAEAKEDLLRVLQEPLLPGNEAHRLKQVEASYARSYRHLSEEAKRLFERLSRLPGGVWWGGDVDKFLTWEKILGANWRELFEKELDYYALVHYEESDAWSGTGTYKMLNPMLEFAKKKYQMASHSEWEKLWVEFWLEKISSWNEAISGKISDSTQQDKESLSKRAQSLAKFFYTQTQENWITVFHHLAVTKNPSIKNVLLDMAFFCNLSGQRPLLKDLAQIAVEVARGLDEAMLAPCLGTLGTVLSELGRRDAALAAFDEALGIYRPQAHPAAYQPDVAMTLNNLGTVLSDLGRRDEALAAYNEALDIYRQLAQAHPAAYQPAVAMTLNNLGNVLRELGQNKEALSCFQEALELYKPFVDEWPAAFSQNFSVVLRNYISVAEESDTDPWWQLWKQWQNSQKKPGPS